MLKVCLLGCGGTLPLPARYLTALQLSYNGNMLLIDCGEGTQVSMKMVGWGFKYIEAICFTHYHADHIVGLPGMLLTIANSGRTDPLIIIGPIGLEEVINGLRVLFPYLPYELKLIEIEDTGKVEYKVKDFLIKTLSVNHGVPCLAYSIDIKRNKRFDKAMAENNKVPIKLWNRLQKEEQVEYEGRLFTPDLVLGEERKGIKLCYCTDTRPIESIIHFAKDSDLFICEGMYGDEDCLPKALENKHMLFSEAAELAFKAEVSELWLTHYSPSLIDPEAYIENAVGIFNNTKLGYDRRSKEIIFLK
jgi:ribonuclease Z